MEQQNSVLPALTPSKITAWLDCPHYLNLKHQRNPQGSRCGYIRGRTFARLLLDKVFRTKRQLRLPTSTQVSTSTVSPTKRQVSRSLIGLATSRHLAAEVDNIFQMSLLHNGIRGVADFLERRIDPETGDSVWSPVDAKLAERS